MKEIRVAEIEKVSAEKLVGKNEANNEKREIVGDDVIRNLIKRARESREKERDEASKQREEKKKQLLMSYR